MSEVRETQLPGTGVRHDFETRQGTRVGVLLHRSGRRDLLVYDEIDPDACLVTVDLEPEDAATLVELLGGSQVIEAVGEAVQQRVQGLAIDWIPLASRSTIVGQNLGDAALRTRTGASVVAVIRGDATVPSPTPEFVFEAGDTVVAVGTDEGIALLTDLIQGRA
ncbi:MAG TPA: TrkA C-terminal domain-containing protein [Acidimicrobiia bacterium]|nr:TrkA C-terminal domain-containing protein [Acidimicrobiia bacterium]